MTAAGISTSETFCRQFEDMNKQIRDKEALRIDLDSAGEEFAWVDADVMGPEFMGIYERMAQTGYARGWL